MQNPAISKSTRQISQTVTDRAEHNAPLKQQACFHCGERVTQSLLDVQPELRVSVNDELRFFCCTGCLSVSEFILQSEQGEYYALREGFPEKADPESQERIRQWQYYDDKSEHWGELDAKTGQYRLYLDISGMHCGACVWLIRNRLLRLSSVNEVRIDAATGVSSIDWSPDETRFSDLFKTIIGLGYRPALLGGSLDIDSGLDESLKRLVVAGLGMMQVMMYAVALYAGEWNGMDAMYQRFLVWVSLFVTTPVLFYSGLPFIKNAVFAVRNRSVHMDIPIALAMLLAFSLSCINFFRAQGSVYFDSVVMFIFFITAARYIQQRVQKSSFLTRQALARMLPDFVRTPDGQFKPATSIEVDDELLVATGEALPVDGVQLSGEAELDESLLTGESLPVMHYRDEALAAGSINLGQPLRIRASTTMSDSSLSLLGRRLLVNSLHKTRVQSKLAKFSSIFVLAVILLAVISCLVWMWLGDLERGIEAALAVLVISCPCAISLAIPTALSALTQGLHRQGIHVLNSDALMQIPYVKKVLFDKTGTLTEVNSSPDSLQLLPGHELTKGQCLEIIAALSRHSVHPVARAFHTLETSYCVDSIEELPGHGIKGCMDGMEYIFVKAAYFDSLDNSPTEICNYSGNLLARKQGKNFQMLAKASVEQSLRQGSREVITQLQRTSVHVEIISGDAENAVKKAAQGLGVDRYFSGLSSQQKREHIQAQRSAFAVAAIGDGINDAEVLSEAGVSVSFTEASQMAQASADVLISGRSLLPLNKLMAASKHLMAVVKINLSWALLYNLILIPLAVMAYIKPWMAALGMSLSSLFVILNSSRLQKLPQLLGKTR